MLECDLIMKGGITSGVVYPYAITEIAEKYRLRSIGGTSAGAIGAVFAAAAEYRRQTAPQGEEKQGFKAIEGVADELAADLRTLFQPDRKLKPLFRVLEALIDTPENKSKAASLVRAVLTSYWPHSLTGAAIGAALAAGGFVRGDLSLVLLGLVLLIVLPALLVGGAVVKAIAVDLPAADFGLCPGRTQHGEDKPAFTDWMADKIDSIAGNIGDSGFPGTPLTVGDLRRHGIEIASMTTDLSSRRPYELPLKARTHCFSEAEFRRLFPARIVDYLKQYGKRVEARTPDAPMDLYQLPVGDAFPVLLAARMSLSFPGLISAIPLYRVDFGLADSNGHAPMRRCLFSDGGLSSNFPVHFFDSILPTRPTFGIALTSYDPVRHGTRPEDRIDLPSGRLHSDVLPVGSITSLGSFAMAMLNTAKDWQDTLQSMLPGWSERIVQIRLDDSREGGLNLGMSGETVRQLAGYGEAAGKLVIDKFEFDEHRWRRARTTMPLLEEAFTAFARAYKARPPGHGKGDSGGGGDARDYSEVLVDYDARSYPVSGMWRAQVLDKYAGQIAAIGETIAAEAAKQQKLTIREEPRPHVDASIRVIADADRDPVGGGD